MEHWESLKPGGYRFVWDDALFPPGTDTFLLSSLPRLKPNLRVCDLEIRFQPGQGGEDRKSVV